VISQQNQTENDEKHFTAAGPANRLLVSSALSAILWRFSFFFTFLRPVAMTTGSPMSRR
jgi:hypothetical protein